MFKKLLFTLLAALFLVSASSIELSAQTSTAEVGFTPYSLFGLGDLATQGTSYNRSMGGIGIGDRNVRQINYLNPASISAREKQSFMLDFGVEQNNKYFSAYGASAVNATSSEKLTTVNNTFNMHHLIASFPIYKSSAFVVGITPYSSVGYNFKAKETDDNVIAQMGDITYNKIGQGGIYQGFLGASVTLFDRLSLGAEGIFYFGTVNRYSSAYFNTNTSYRTISSGWTNVTRGFTGKFGLQYQQPLSSNVSATIGATYSLGTTLNTEQTRYAYGVSTNATDTIIHNVQMVDTYSIPQEFGVGITIRHRDKWMVGFDYTRQDWSTVTLEATPGVDFKPVASQSFRFGFEITPNMYDIRYFMRRLTYRAGAYYTNSYVSLNGHQINSQGITLGVSIPVFRYYNSVTFGIDMGQRGTLQNNLVRERYFLFTLSIDLHDIWFIKPLYQ